MSAQRLIAGCPFGHRCHLHARGISCSKARSSPWLRMFFVTCASAVAAAAVLGLNLFEGGPVGDCGEGCSEGFSVDVPRVVVAVAPQLELCTAKMSDITAHAPVVFDSTVALKAGFAGRYVFIFISWERTRGAYCL